MSQTSRAILARSAASRPQRSWAMPPCQAAGLSVRAAQGGMRRVTVRAAGSGQPETRAAVPLLVGGAASTSIRRALPGPPRSDPARRSIRSGPSRASAPGQPRRNQRFRARASTPSARSRGGLDAPRPATTAPDFLQTDQTHSPLAESVVQAPGTSTAHGTAPNQRPLRFASAAPTRASDR